MTTLKYKIFSPEGNYIAACKHATEAAILVAGLGTGSEIRNGHKKSDTLWREGHEAHRAADSYDVVALTVWSREDAREKAALARMEASLIR